MSSDPEDAAQVSREEFEQFLHAFTHEIRNRLNGIALEAADLMEQMGEQSDSKRLQEQVQECSKFLKQARETLAPEDTRAKRVTLDEFIRQLKRK